MQGLCYMSCLSLKLQARWLVLGIKSYFFLGARNELISVMYVVSFELLI